MLWLTGCASQLPQAPQLPGGNGLPTQWQLSGKFAVKTPADNGTSRINWQQTNEQYAINLYTLFGISILSIEGDDKAVRIDGKRVYGRSPEQVVEHITGWQLPVSNLKYWLLGQVDNAREVSYDDQGNFSRGLLYDNAGHPWQLTLSKYKKVQGRMLPHKVSLQQPDVNLRLAISSWTIIK